MDADSTRTPDEAARLQLARELLAEAMGQFTTPWTVDGELVLGPNGVTILVDDLDGGGPTHLDIGVMLNHEQPDSPVIWDCVAGFGDTVRESVQSAIRIWTSSTAPVTLELRAQSGRFADHYRGHDEGGFPGWHTMHGPIFGWGAKKSGERLQRWTLDHPLLPQLHAAIAPYLDRTGVNGIKLFYGHSTETQIGEVRINGVVHEEPTEALLQLPWPRARANEPGCLRVFVLLVHEEDAQPDTSEPPVLVAAGGRPSSNRSGGGPWRQWLRGLLR